MSQPFDIQNEEKPGSLPSREIAEQEEDDNISPEARWIKNNMSMRVCKSFVKDDPNESYSNTCLCKCGQKKKDHTTPSRLRQENKWQVDTNTGTVPTNTFGEIEFIGHGEKERKFVRVDVNTGMDKMKHLMMDIWGLEKPNILISVTGGAGIFNMKAKLKEAFRRGLMKAARSTGAWIVTGGTNTGVMKHVGEAVRDYGLTTTTGAPAVAIGVATWGCIHNKEKLVSGDNGLHPAQYRVSSEKPEVHNEAYLDPNHTHFILVDDGTEHKFGVEIKFRSKLEEAVASMTINTGTVLAGGLNAVKVPVCLLVLEGGPGTLETVQQSILNNIPIIIVQGSGRAADILATAYNYQCSKENEKDKNGKKTRGAETEFDNTQETRIKEMIKGAFGDKNIDNNWKMVKESLVNRDLVTVFDLNPASTNQAHRDIDYAILQALLKASKDQVYDQLKLALAWNRIDIVKSEIFVDDRTWTAGSLDDILQSAIMLNRKDFIELFLDNGVILKDFTSSRLEQLYNQIPRKCHLAMALEKIKKKDGTDVTGSSTTFRDVGHLIQDLIGDFYASHHLTTEATVSKDAVQELFFWSVLMNRQELAKLFWNLGKDAIASALVAYGLLIKMSKRTDDIELKKSFIRNALEFSDLAIKVLNECHETDEKKARQLLIRQLDKWGRATCVLIAVETQNKHFISQTACQSLLNREWMGRLSNDNGALKLLSCVFFPPLMFPLIKYEDEETQDPGNIGTDNDPGAKPTKEEGKHAVMVKRQSQLSMQTIILPDEKAPRVSFPRKLYYFYTSPVIIFIHNVLAYLIFLALFSYMLLVELNSSVSVIEIILMVWVFSIFAEEIRQLIMTSSSTFWTKLCSYIKDHWNMVDVVTILLFVCALILRFLPYDFTMEAARVVYAVNFITFFFRILHICSVHRKLGPKLVMIGTMAEFYDTQNFTLKCKLFKLRFGMWCLTPLSTIFQLYRGSQFYWWRKREYPEKCCKFFDLSYFMVILMVFVISYAIASYSILYPNSSLTGDVLIKVMRMSYWNLYGELFIEEIELEEPHCSFDPAIYNNNTLPRCPSEVGRYSTPILMGIYVLFANILLLNLLIAMFSFSIQKIQDETDQHWNFRRCVLIYEYHSKPPLPTPLILISHMLLIFCWIFQQCRSCCVPNKKSTKPFSNERELIQWENVIADTYLQRQELKENETLEMKVKLTHQGLDTLLARMDQIQEALHPLPTAAAPAANDNVQPIDKMLPQMDKRLKNVEKQLQVTTESLKWLVDAMKSNQMAATDPTPDVSIMKKKQEDNTDI